MFLRCIYFCFGDCCAPLEVLLAPIAQRSSPSGSAPLRLGAGMVVVQGVCSAAPSPFRRTPTATLGRAEYAAAVKRSQRPCGLLYAVVVGLDDRRPLACFPGGGRGFETPKKHVGPRRVELRSGWLPMCALFCATHRRVNRESTHRRSIASSLRARVAPWAFVPSYRTDNIQTPAETPSLRLVPGVSRRRPAWSPEAAHGVASRPGHTVAPPPRVVCLVCLRSVVVVGCVCV